jgi:hypothetical protein
MQRWKFERMDGLALTAEVQKIQEAVKVLNDNLTAEGFDEQEITDYLETVVFLQVSRLHSIY